MATRKPINNAPLSGRISDSLNELVGGDAQHLAQVYLETTQRCEEIAKSFAKRSEEQTRSITGSATKSMGDFMKSIDESAEKTGKRVSENLGKGFEEAADKAEKSSKRVKKSFEENSPTKTKGLDAYISQLVSMEGVAAGAAQGVGAVTTAVEGLGIAAVDVGEILTLGPLGVALAALGTYLASLITTVNHLNDMMVALEVRTGGAGNEFKSFVSQVRSVVTATNLSRDEVYKLGDAFHDAGMPISNASDSLGKYMNVAGEGIKVFGLSDEAAAKYIRTLRDSGMTAAQIENNWSALYQTMHDANLNTKELIESFSEGDTVWREFGGTTGKTLDQFQSDVLRMKDIFKSFNIDVKDTANSLSSMFGKPQDMVKQASFVSNILGMSSGAALSMAYSDSPNFKLKQSQALLTLLGRETGGDLAMNQSELSSKYGDQLGNIELGRSIHLQNAIKRSNLPSQEAQGMLNSYIGFMHSDV
jgi:hypothetical protein